MGNLPEKPNLLLIMTDQDRGLMHFPPGWEEKNLVAMPRLRKKGISFTNAFCSTCMCSPSRATTFTGVYPPQHGVTLTLTEGMPYSNREKTLPMGMQNMARMLKAGGYSVNYIGKWHLSKDVEGDYDHLTSARLAAYGFDGWTPPDAGEDTAPEHFGGGIANNDLRYINEAIDFLQQQQMNRSRKPFALILSLVNPHDVLAYPADWGEDGISPNYSNKYLVGDIQLPKNINENLKENYKPVVQQLFLPYCNAGLGALTDETMQLNYLNFYGNLIRQSDSLINSVLDTLYQVYDTIEGKSLAHDTIVIRTADHGEMGLTHGGMRQKAYNAYEETIHVPMVISNPVLFPEGKMTDELMTLVDIMPTISTLLNVNNPLNYTLKGADLSPVILGTATEPVQEEILFTFDDFRAGNANLLDPMPTANRIRCIREKDWKYSEYFYIAPEGKDPKMSHPNEYEMYHLKEDPHEMENLANPDHPRYNDPFVVAERNRLAAKLATLKDQKLAW
ncbi:MAG: sulfatase-like hydrolase/transferase [Spirosomataceae bacterium]